MRLSPQKDRALVQMAEQRSVHQPFPTSRGKGPPRLRPGAWAVPGRRPGPHTMAGPAAHGDGHGLLAMLALSWCSPALASQDFAALLVFPPFYLLHSGWCPNPSLGGLAMSCQAWLDNIQSLSWSHLGRCSCVCGCFLLAQFEGAWV